MKVWILALAFGVSVFPALAQDKPVPGEDILGASTPRKMTAREAFSGKTFPLTMKLKDLDGDWRVFSASDASSNQALVNLFALSGGGTGLNSSFTKGDEVTLGSENFIVAYRPKVKLPSMATLSSQALDPHAFDSMKLTESSTLSLALINLRTMGAMSDIRPFDLKEFLAQSEEASPPGIKENPTGAKPVETEPEANGAKTVVSLGNLRQLGLAVSMYTQDYDETLPPMKSYAKFKEVLTPYVKNLNAFLNPITRTPYALNEAITSHKLAHLLKPVEMAVIYEAEPAPDGTRGVVFLDGHVLRADDAEWTLIKKRSKIK